MFLSFLQNIKTPDNKKILEAIISAYSVFESLSTDDANEKPMGSVIKYEEPAPIVSFPTEDSVNSYFKPSLPPEKLDIVAKSQLGFGREAAYPGSGKTVSINDPSRNQFGTV